MMLVTISLILVIIQLVSMLLGCFAGLKAIERIRAAWPRLYGLGAALVGLWFLPLYAVNAAAVGGPFAALDALGVTLPVWAIVLQALAWLALDVYWIAGRRRRILRELEAAVPGPEKS
jgi:Mn2+/Fe2+ NRAMP family transporter